MANVWFTIGGSHRQYKKDMDAIKRAEIPGRWAGPVAYKSKLSIYAVDENDAARMTALGFRRCKAQPQERTTEKLL